jgi:hypothetical protein
MRDGKKKEGKKERKKLFLFSLALSILNLKRGLKPDNPRLRMST